LFFDRFLRSNDKLDKERGHHIHDGTDRLCDGIYHQSFPGGLLFGFAAYFKKEVESSSIMVANG
jgi:hypothetical protein